MPPHLFTARWLLPVALATVLLAGVAPSSSADDTDLCAGHVPTIVGTPGNDELIGTRGDDVIAGLGGDDVIRGRAGDDVICGGGGDDLLSGGAGMDVLLGDTGRDTVSYAGAPEAVRVDLAAGTGDGGFGTDRIAAVENVTGSAWGDTLTGDDGANRLRGGPGNDLLTGLDGDDELAGGLGFDTASYVSAGAPVAVSLRQGRSAGGAGADRLFTLEGVAGSPWDDFLDGNAAGNRLDGYGGDDVLRGWAGGDVLVGGTGMDVAVGSAGIDDCEAEAERGCDPADPGDSKNCADFLTQAHAQAWFEAFYPAYGDVARLDADGNGIACENLGG